MPSFEVIEATGAQLPGVFKEEVLAEGQGGISLGDDLIRDHHGKARCYLANLLAITRNEIGGSIGFCTFRQRIKLRAKLKWGGAVDDSWGDRDTALFKAHIEREYGFSPSLRMVDLAVRSVAQDSPFNPVVEYLTGLKWDAKPRLDSWLCDYLGAAQTEYNSVVGKRWLISLVARAMQPGCQVDHLLVLEGPQGKRKTSAFLALIPDPSWVSTGYLDLTGKDGVMLLQGRWLVLFEELEGLDSTGAARIKAFVSCRSDQIRPPYGHHVIDLPRHCGFGASTNETSYLKDSTGGRRWWPVEVGEVDLDGLAKVRDQLWAEAVFRFDAGELWYLTEEEEVLARDEQEARRVVDPMEEVIQNATTYLTQGTLTQVAELVGIDPSNPSSRAMKGLARSLQRMGWKRRRGPLKRGKPRSWVLINPAFKFTDEED